MNNIMNNKLNKLIDYLNKNNFYKEAKLLKEAMPIYFKDEGIKDYYDSNMSSKIINEEMKQNLEKIKQDIEIVTFFDDPLFEYIELFSSIIKYIKDIHKSDQNPHFIDETTVDTFIIEKQVMLQALDELKEEIKKLKNNEFFNRFDNEDFEYIQDDLISNKKRFLAIALSIALDDSMKEKIHFEEIPFKAFEYVDDMINLIFNKLKDADDPEKITFILSRGKPEYNLTTNLIIHDIMGHSLSQYFEDFKEKFDNFFKKFLIQLGNYPNQMSHQDIIRELYYLKNNDKMNPLKDVFGFNFFAQDFNDAMMDIYVSLVRKDTKPTLPDYMKNKGEDVIVAFHEMEQKINWIKVKLETGEALKELMGYYIFNFPQI